MNSAASFFVVIVGIATVVAVAAALYSNLRRSGGVYPDIPPPSEERDFGAYAGIWLTGNRDVRIDYLAKNPETLSRLLQFLGAVVVVERGRVTWRIIETPEEPLE